MEKLQSLGKGTRCVVGMRKLLCSPEEEPSLRELSVCYVQWVF